MSMEPGENVVTRKAGDENDRSALKLPARELSLPPAISPRAKALLAKAYAERGSTDRPSLDDHVGWQRFVTDHEAPLLPLIEPLLTAPGATLEERFMGGAKVYVAVPDAQRKGGPRVQYNIHGGGWIRLGGKFAAALTKVAAMSFGGIVYGVDYRMPPTHPYPAALDDCLAGYRELLSKYAPKDILVVGSSAGGNLAAALMLRAHDEGLPPPGALFLDTPAVDMTAGSDTLYTNQGIDPRICREDIAGGHLYAGGADLAHPYLSPLNGDLSQSFPPTYLRSGTRDLLLSDTVRMHAKLRKAGVAADLYVGEGMPHTGFDNVMASTPEDQDARDDLLRWIDKQF